MSDDTHACTCGSDARRQPNYDARGIFLCYSCEECHQRKMASYRREVLTDPNYRHDEPTEED